MDDKYELLYAAGASNKEDVMSAAIQSTLKATTNGLFLSQNSKTVAKVAIISIWVIGMSLACARGCFRGCTMPQDPFPLTKLEGDVMDMKLSNGINGCMITTHSLILLAILFSS